MANNKVKEYVEIAKSIPPAIYHLTVINLVMFIGFVIKDLTVLYMVGTLVFIALLLTCISKASGLCDTPTELISQNVRDRFD